MSSSSISHDVKFFIKENEKIWLAKNFIGNLLSHAGTINLACVDLISIYGLHSVVVVLLSRSNYKLSLKKKL